MSLYNLFVLRMERRLERQNITPEQKRKIITTILCRMHEAELLLPVELDFQFDEEPGNSPIDRAMEARILAKQKELGMDVDQVEEKDHSDFKWGRARLHEAVAMGDLDAIKQFIAEGDDTETKDNNGNTPYDIAVLNEQHDVLAILES